MPQSFKLVSDFQPKGDQPRAIEQLVNGLKNNERHQTLLGATGTGKTFTMANIIEREQKPTLVIAHNKTLAAQLCSEFQSFFPDNAVSYFVSYYDYYQPEAYLPATDTYIEKDASINDEIAKYRHAATHNLLSRRDVLIVASVSCIYGLGSPEDYEGLAITIKKGENKMRDKFLRELTDIRYVRSHLEFKQGMVHVLGDTIEIFPPGGDAVIRVEMAFDEIESISEVDSFTGELIREMEETTIFPAAHSVTTREKIERAVGAIRKDLDERETQLMELGEKAKAERLRQRTEYDIEMLMETGYCTGIENYVRYLSGRNPGEPPETLIDYFPDDFLVFIDESHMTIPQIGAMYEGNLNRKNTLVEHGFRLPSCRDNRPLKFGEFESRITRAIYISATPGKYEYKNTGKHNIAEQIIRPTGLIDPVIKVHPSKKQISHMMSKIDEAIQRGERALVTTLTKKNAEDISQYLLDKNYKVKYLHSDIKTFDRVETIRDLRLGKIDAIVGVNLLREGLDLPEVSFIAILDADKEGFLRSRDALIQTIGRCARNVNGQVVLYADKITKAMQEAMHETERRRKIQQKFNNERGITPISIEKAIRDIAEERSRLELRRPRRNHARIPKDERNRLISELENQMEIASQNYEFEKAADIRDEIEMLKRDT